MKKVFILFFLYVFYTNATFANDKLNAFFEKDIEAAKTKAKAEHKGIFILYYADWCGFCQKIFNETLPDEGVQRALQAGFACYKVQNSSEEGNVFRTKYDIRSLPTLLFFDENGELVLKQPGMQTKAKIFALINKVYDEYYHKNTPREFSFTPNLLAAKNIASLENSDKNLTPVQESIAVAVACTGTGACDDGNACTSNDVCVRGVCTGTTITCPDDADPCTTAACNIVTGCYQAFNTNSCNDGNPCTLNDACSNGICRGGTIKSCSDGNPCTDDVCDMNTGTCTNPFNSVSCNDGNACTSGDFCANGTCQAGTGTINCNDSNGCTNDTCNPATGCIFTVNNSNSCSDNNVCTANDHCVNGVCNGTAISCPEDNDVCTTAACNGTTGCYQAFNTNACDDGNPNTINDVCSSGVCAGIVPSYTTITPLGITLPKLAVFPTTCNASNKSFMFYHTGQNLVYVCDGANWVQLQNYADAVFETSLATATQAIPANNGVVTIDFGTPVINVGNNFDPATNVFTATKDGFYHFDATTCLSASAGIVFTLEIIDQNGNVLANQRTTSSNTTQMISCSVSKKLTNGDSVKVVVFQNNTIANDISQNCTRFSGFRVY